MMDFSVVANRIMNMFMHEVPQFGAGMVRGAYEVTKNGEPLGIKHSTYDLASKKADELAKDWCRARMVEIMQEELASA